MKSELSLPAATPAPPSRLESLDVLRGFDMICMAVGEEIGRGLHAAFPNVVTAWIASQFSHVSWQGVHFYDLIFPLFVFIAGISIVYSVDRMVESGGRSKALRRIFTRTAILVLLGIFYYRGIENGYEKIRLLGVLQRIGLCYGAAAMLYCFFKTRGLIGWTLGLLLGYWAMMALVPVPGVGAGNYAEGLNLANYVDKQWLPLRKWDGDHDPEGLLSTIPAVGSCLLGVLAGILLKSPQWNPVQKIRALLIAGVAGIALGHLWGFSFPVVKKIWTSSYVLVAAGWSSLLMAVFYQIVDVWKFKSWTPVCLWVGLNPIAFYMSHNLIDFEKIGNRFVGGEIKAALGHGHELVLNLVILALMIALVRFMHQRRVYLRV